MFQMNVLICVHSVLVSTLLTYIKHERRVIVRVVVFNATFNNILVIFWWSILLVEETGVPRENHRAFVSHWQTLSHNVVSHTPRHEGIRSMKEK
jgi:hypothetical protein